MADLDLAGWSQRLAESHVALGRAKRELILQHATAYLDSQEPSASGAKQHADALTASVRASVASLEADVAAQQVIVDLLRRVADGSTFPIPRNADWE